MFIYMYVFRIFIENSNFFICIILVKLVCLLKWKLSIAAFVTLFALICIMFLLLLSLFPLLMLSRSRFVYYLALEVNKYLHSSVYPSALLLLA